MKCVPFLSPTCMIAALIVSASACTVAFGDTKTELSKELTRIVFPKEKLIARMAHQLPEDNRQAAMEAMNRLFNYSRVEGEIANVYMSMFSLQELRAAVAYHKTTAGRTAMAAIEGSPTAEHLPQRPESPPADTTSSRLSQDLVG